MHAIRQDEGRRNREWTRAGALICLALTLAAAALDRRNSVMDRIAAPANGQARPVAPPTPALMVQDMLEHD